MQCCLHVHGYQTIRWSTDCFFRGNIPEENGLFLPKPSISARSSSARVGDFMNPSASVLGFWQAWCCVCGHSCLLFMCTVLSMSRKYCLTADIHYSLSDSLLRGSRASRGGRECYTDVPFGAEHA